MADRVAQFVIGMGGDDADLRTVMSAIKSRFRSDVAELEKITGSVELFGSIQNSVPMVEAALKRAKDRAADLTAEIQRIGAAGAVPLPALTKELAAQEKAAERATKELARQNAELASLGTKLNKAGVDTRNLAAEQTRLATAITAANKAATEQAAKDLLGFKSAKDIAPEIAKVREAFEQLRASGKLSASEIAAAQKLAADKIRELQGEVSKTGFQFKELGSTGSAALVGLATRVLAPVATLGTLTSAISSAIDAAHRYHDGLAAIGSVTDVQRDKLNELGRGARQVAQDLGIDLGGALKGVYELLRSGVPAENAIDVLRASAVAAKARLEDVSSGVKAANALISGFGVPVTEVARALDMVVRAAKDGGPTLEEFGSGASNLLAVARTANIELPDLVATLGVLTNATGNAGESMGALQQIIVRLETGQARRKLRELGIEGNSLVHIFTELGKRGLTIDNVLELGIASSKTAAGVAQLTTNAEALVPELEKIGKSSGIAARGVHEILDSPKGRSERFNAALTETNTRLGETFGSGSVILSLGTKWLQGFNANLAAIERMQDVAAKTKSPLEGLKAGFSGSAEAAKQAADGLGAAADATQAAAAKAAAATAQIGTAKKELKEFSDELAKQSAAIQQAAAADIADVTKRAEEQIAVLDRSAKATADTATKTLEIQRVAAQERLKILLNSEAQVRSATEATIAARERLARESGKAERDIAQESANARLAALGPVLAAYQAHYSQLVSIAQANAAKLDSLERERLSFNEDVAARLRALRTEGLSDFDVYVQKVRDAEDLIRKAREAGANGDIALAKKYTDQAIALSDSVSRVINADGIEIVSALDVQQTKINILTRAAQTYNDALARAGEAAKKGTDVFGASAADMAEKLRELQGQYDTLRASVAQGVQLKVALDSDSLRSAMAAIDAAIANRTVTVVVNTTTGAPVEQRASGGPVGLRVGGYAPKGLSSAIAPLAQAYAAGGHVFRRRPWAKVPGVGNADTVPTMLQAGSFVVRKDASRLYGDQLMRALANGGVQRFADGGPALFDLFRGKPNVFGLRKGDYPSSSDPAFRNAGGGFDAPRLPSDQEDLERVIQRYVTDVKSAALKDYFFWRKDIDALAYAMRFYEQAPTQENLLLILQRARNIGLNLGAPDGTLEGFDVDGRKWHKRRINISGQAASVFAYEFFNRGGAAGTGDSVRALLTPGEWVIPKRVAAALGSDLLHAINNMQIAPPTLAGVLARTSLAPPPQRFAYGGAVPGAAIMAGPSTTAWKSAGSGNTYNFNIYGAGENIEDVFRRKLVPMLQAMERRTGPK